MHHTSHIEINKSALEKNIEFIKNIVKPGVKISSVVKGDAYGHGIKYFVPMAEQLGINHFSVFSSDEALQVFNSIENKSTILIMGFIDNSELEWAIKNNIEFFVFEKDRLQHAIKVASELGKKAKIHIEIETGLNRTGFLKKELLEVIDLLKSKHLDLIGMCTHFAGAESIANFHRIKEQKKKFLNIHKWLDNKGIVVRDKHVACSAALIRFPDTQMDMVRVGIMQYGLWPNMETFIHHVTKSRNNSSPLKRVINWKSKVMSIKKVPAGQFISYGTSYLTEVETTIASVPVGYAHGYDRGLSNQGRVIINGKRVNVVGLVNMNMLLVDITEAGEINKGDEVILIGSDGDVEVSVASFSEMTNQLNYEMLTRLPKDIPRKIVE